MKKEGHPDYHFITVVLTTGEEYVTRSTYGKPGARLVLDVDCHTWSESGSESHQQIGRVGRYKKRYGWMGSSNTNTNGSANSPKD